MASLNQDIKEKLSRLHVLEKIILINTLVFILDAIIGVFSQPNQLLILHWFSLPNNFWQVIVNPWTIISYGFLHYNFGHLFFNMLVLYFLVQTYSNLFHPRLSLKLYLLGILSGAIAFILTTMFIPSILNINGPLVGASAGVRACILFLCFYMPNKMVGILKIRFQLKYLGIALVLLDLPGLFSSNSGGTVAHIGGYILAYFYARQLQLGNEPAIFFDKILDYFNKNQKLKTIYRKPKKTFAGKQKQDFDSYTHQKQIDLILDKISKSGYDSLTQEEKDFLFRTGK